ncbi:MAG: M42 family peptidase [Clostridia bacterium]|nr:M42 family peptidase [Clostridia bacterium]
MTDSFLNTLKALCALNGTSGREDAVRAHLIDRVNNHCDYHVDALGNLICRVLGKRRAKNTVMLSAHMDEVGFMITDVTKDGDLRFDAVGGIDKKVVCGKAVTVGDRAVHGVIGVKPIHLTDKADSGKVPELDELFIDIGAASKEEAQQFAQVGDAAYFQSEWRDLGEHKVKMKALDDRFGCAVLLNLIERTPAVDCTVAFLVQEEVGLRGAGPAAFQVRPDAALILETTTAADVAGVSGAETVCHLGGGAVVPFMDRSTVYDRALFQTAFDCAKQAGIPVQTKTRVAGGNDAGAIHKSCAGVRVLNVSLPCRYLHSASTVADKRDMDACIALCDALLPVLADA